jgi:hypothetical protein
LDFIGSIVNRRQTNEVAKYSDKKEQLQFETFFDMAGVYKTTRENDVGLGVV